MRQFAAGMFLGLAVAAGISSYMWQARYRNPVPQRDSGEARPTSTAPVAPPSNELTAAKRTIEELQREIDRLKALTRTSQPAKGSRTWEELAPLLVAQLQHWEPNDPITAKLILDVQRLVAEAASEEGVSVEEASVSTRGWAKFLAMVTAAWNPPLRAEQSSQISEILQQNEADWAGYLRDRDSMMGLERISRLEDLKSSFDKRFDDVLDRQQQDVFDTYDSFWSHVAMWRGVRDISRLAPRSTAEMRRELVDEWSESLALRPEQKDRLGGLVDDYLSAVKQARAATAGGDPDEQPRVPVERACMIAIQKRMPAALGLDATQLERLQRWSDVPLVELTD